MRVEPTDQLANAVQHVVVMRSDQQCLLVLERNDGDAGVGLALAAVELVQLLRHLLRRALEQWNDGDATGADTSFGQGVQELLDLGDFGRRAAHQQRCRSRRRYERDLGRDDRPDDGNELRRVAFLQANDLRGELVCAALGGGAFEPGNDLAAAHMIDTADLLEDQPVLGEDIAHDLQHLTLRQGLLGMESELLGIEFLAGNPEAKE
jgi:hypothetical protein